MKNKLKILMLAAVTSVSSVALQSCGTGAKSDKASLSEKKEAAAIAGSMYKTDTAAPMVTFRGESVTHGQTGTFRLSDGGVAVKDGKITGGNFTININSMVTEHTDPKLRKHLLSADFFDAAQYPDAKFEITTAEPYKPAGNDTSAVQGANYKLSGNLTLKGITRNISFPAKIEINGSTLTGQANFDIDRTWWNMHYGNDKSLGDRFMYPTVNIKLDIRANS